MSSWCILRCSTNVSQPLRCETAALKKFEHALMIMFALMNVNKGYYPSVCLPVLSVWTQGVDPCRGVSHTKCKYVETLRLLLPQALDVLKVEPNALELCAPLKIVGDLHGQFFDLISMLDHCGAPGNGSRRVLGNMIMRLLLTCSGVQWCYSFD